jgi:predicted metalloprotease
MRMDDRRESDNVEDRRGEDGGNGAGRIGLPLRGKGGLGVLILVLVAGYYGIDLTPLLGGDGALPTQSHSQSHQSRAASPEEESLAHFSSKVLASTEDSWSAIFAKAGKQYQPPKLVLYRGATRTGCGQGQSVMGPFYCPVDRSVYIDLSFYQQLRDQLGAAGDFAQGYVVAHEVGHHVQNLLGIERQVREQQRGLDQAAQNRLSVKLELQADCFAGVWGHYMQGEQALDPDDLQEALNAAEAIGDDKLQQQTSGRVVPDSFTHGTSAQRYSWFKRGFDQGDPAVCNTFAAAR